MKVIKINAIWCSACLVMNNNWNKVLKEKNIETISLDYDVDEEEVEKYNVGEVLPVFIFYKDDKEIYRFSGEKSYKDLINLVEELNK